MSNIKVNTIEAQSGNSIVSNSFIKFNAAPISPNDLANKGYVDSILTASGIGVQALYVDTQDQFYASQADAKFVDKANGLSETITGTKTFTKTPICTVEPATLNELTNRSYVDNQDASTLSQANAYTNSQVSSILVSSSTPFNKVSIPQGVTGSNAFYTDPVAPNLTARDTNFLYGTNSNYFVLEGINGLTITGSDEEETFNRVTGNTVAEVTENVNRIKIDANSLGHAPQVWTDVAASRTSGVTYTNTTSKPIMIIARPTSASNVIIVVGGVTVYSNLSSSEPPSFVVPIGATYSITFTGAISSWVELR
jgi:hypothetical protein